MSKRANKPPPEPAGQLPPERAVTPEQLDDYLPLKEACNKLRSHRTGKRVHLATARRWIRTGKLPAVRRGRWFFVRLADLAAMMQPAEVQKPLPVSTPRQRKAQDAWAEKILREEGVIK